MNHVAHESAKLTQYSASGTEVILKKISPALEQVSSRTWQGELFRRASLSWSVTVCSGFGRRLRYIVRDQSNGNELGIEKAEYGAMRAGHLK